VCGRFNRYPVADGGEIGAGGRPVPQASGHARQDLASLREHAVDVRVLQAHAPRRQPRGRM
jgi:hypothetical protein